MKNLNAVKYSMGSVAYIRTTEEPVFVLNIEDKGEDHPGEVTVRRPTRNDRGVVHLVEYFFCDELCGYEDVVNAAAKRHEIEAAVERRMYEKSKAQNDAPATPALKGPLLN